MIIDVTLFLRIRSRKYVLGVFDEFQRFVVMQLFAVLVFLLREYCEFFERILHLAVFVHFEERFQFFVERENFRLQIIYVVDRFVDLQGNGIANPFQL